MNQRLLGAWAGVIGSALFVTIFTIEGWLRPDYDPLSMFVSELSLGPRGWIQMVNFVVVGLLFVLFARAVAVEFRVGTASKAGPILLTIIGLSLLVSGPFVMDPASTPRDLMTWHSLAVRFVRVFPRTRKLLGLSPALLERLGVAIIPLVDTWYRGTHDSRRHCAVGRSNATTCGTKYLQSVEWSDATCNPRSVFPVDIRLCVTHDSAQENPVGRPVVNVQ